MSPWFIGSIALTAVSWVAWTVLLARDIFPDKTPIHWNIDLEIDGWTSGQNAARGLIVMPIIMTMLLAINALVNRFSPIGDDVTRRRFDYTICLALAFFLCVSGMVIVAMRSGEFPIRYLMGLMFVFFGLVGRAMHGLKPNRWIGVRTPWTMSDEQVWTRTHEFTAKLWPALAAVGLVLASLGVSPMILLLLIVPLGVLPVIASYVFSRTHPAN